MNTLKSIVNDAKTLPERFLKGLARYYISKYKLRLKRGYETTEDEDVLFAYAVQYLNKGE